MKHLIYCLLLSSVTCLALEETYFTEETLDVPVREQAIIITKDGFYPDAFSVFKGEKVRFIVTTTTDEPGCLSLASKNFFLSAYNKMISEKEVYFDEEGVYEFNCPTNKLKGRITVLERPDDKRNRIQREIASEKKYQLWMPREE